MPTRTVIPFVRGRQSLWLNAAMLPVCDTQTGMQTNERSHFIKSTSDELPNSIQGTAGKPTGSILKLCNSCLVYPKDSRNPLPGKASRPPFTGEQIAKRWGCGLKGVIPEKFDNPRPISHLRFDPVRFPLDVGPLVDLKPLGDLLLEEPQLVPALFQVPAQGLRFGLVRQRFWRF